MAPSPVPSPAKVTMGRTIAVTVMTAPTDRSMPPAMTTTVWPIADQADHRRQLEDVAQVRPRRRSHGSGTPAATHRPMTTA